MAVPASYAILNGMRLNAARLNSVPAALMAVRRTMIHISLNGTEVRQRVRRESLTVSDGLNDTANTCAFTISGSPAPQVAQSLRFTLGADPPRTIFVGAVQTVEETYEGGQRTPVYRCTGIDDTFRVERRRPFGTWTSVSATTIAQQIISSYAPGFSSSGVQAGLPPVSVNLDGTEGMNGAFRQLAKLIGGYFNFEDKVAYLFQTQSGSPPDPLDPAHPTFLDEPAVKLATDLSQVRTRVYGKGHAENTLSDVTAGETILPVADTVLFNAAGGQAIALTQRLTYTGVIAGGPSSVLVGTPTAPTSGLNTAPINGPGVDVGTHIYAYTWVNAQGETLPSPSIAGASWDMPPPSFGGALAAQPTVVSTVNGFLVNDTIDIAVSQSYNLGMTMGTSPLATGGSITIPPYTGNTAFACQLYYTVSGTFPPNMPPGGTLYVHVWIQRNGGGYKKEATYTMGGTPFSFSSNVVNWNVNGQPPPASPDATMRRLYLTGIATGPAGTVARRLYRSPAGSNQLKLLATLNDNTTTAYTDSTADAALGVEAPKSGSVLVPAGATTIPVTSTAPFSSAGGWVITGSQVLRYTGISADTLAITGVVNLTSPLNRGDHIDAAPALTGVSGIAVPIAQGTPIALWIQVDDANRQAALGALDGSDGIVEYVISDERRGESSLRDLCSADLQRFGQPLTTITYATRDIKTKSGLPITVNLPSLGISGTWTIQTVEITEIDVVPGLAPRYAVTASSVRTSLEELLRLLAGDSAIGGVLS